MPPGLHVRQLQKRYGGFAALTDVSLDMCDGEVLGLIGPNGAGKTTLFELVKFSSREHRFMLDRSQWHQLKLTVDQANLKADPDGDLALEYVLGSDPGPGRNGAAPNPDLFAANNPVLRPPVSGKVVSLGQDRQHQLFQRLRHRSEVTTR